MPELLPPDSADLISTLARDWAVQVNTGTIAAPTWTFVNGLNKVDPSIDTTTQDDSDIHGKGYKSTLVTGLGATLALEGLRKGTKDDTTFTPDPGQEFLRGKGEAMGGDNVVHMRVWRTDDLPNAFECKYACAWKDVAGSLDALQSFTVTLSGRGKPDTITKPTAP